MTKASLTIFLGAGSGRRRGGRTGRRDGTVLTTTYHCRDRFRHAHARNASVKLLTWAEVILDTVYGDVADAARHRHVVEGLLPVLSHFFRLQTRRLLRKVEQVDAYLFAADAPFFTVGVSVN